MEANVLTFALISLAGSLVYVAVVVALHFLPTGYNLAHNAVSDYGVGKYAPLFRVSLWAGSIAVLALAIGLTLEPGAPPLVIRDLVFLGLVAAVRIGESLFPTTVEGEKLTRTGAMHYLFAILTFGFTYAAISGLTPDLVKLYPWHSHQGMLDWLSGAVLVGLILVVATLLPRLRRVFGLCERFFLLVTYGWLVLAAYLLAVKAH
ncbi:MAG TPA: DUF998 domain-containing protein [Streptosporangiaceae bacterium]|nr:DUF998 domain-containing protein [Streptosporangiaceae bacterium]